ncbi:hypothetical protein SAMN05444392_101347 [Seinonella peptonophila]|uniref:Uncharacterized protein n=1 Tax=Seinonella peptonophila TaxID=112248 RepID=A0A1M4T7K0_9BACL|nr:hypothetical protein [Seinonella peptonophila]SHE40441.1 hypothetical protein SAMN05444392_101347 [Seinonella peptonophila]
MPTDKFTKGDTKLTEPVSFVKPVKLTKGGEGSIPFSPDMKLTATLEWQGRGLRLGLFGLALGAIIGLLVGEFIVTIILGLLFGSAGFLIGHFLSDLELVALRIPSGGPMIADEIYWDNLGNDTRHPFVKHHGDSKTPGREIITIHNPGSHRHIAFAVYSAFRNGPGSLFSYRARVVVSDGINPPVMVPLYNRKQSYWCTIALITIKNGEVVIKQIEQYNRIGDEHFPQLTADGQIVPGGGPARTYKRRT